MLHNKEGSTEDAAQPATVLDCHSPVHHRLIDSALERPPSEKRLRAVKITTSKNRNSFSPEAVSLINSLPTKDDHKHHTSTSSDCLPAATLPTTCLV